MGICSRNEAGSAIVIQADSGCEESKIENTSRLVDAEGKLSTRFSANLADVVHERDGVLEHGVWGVGVWGVGCLEMARAVRLPPSGQRVADLPVVSHLGVILEHIVGERGLVAGSRGKRGWSSHTLPKWAKQDITDARGSAQSEGEWAQRCEARAEVKWGGTLGFEAQRTNLSLAEGK